LNVCIKVKDAWYRLMGKPPFKGDMEYVRDCAIRLGGKVEAADSGSFEVFLECTILLRFKELEVSLVTAVGVFKQNDTYLYHLSKAG